MSSTVLYGTLKANMPSEVAGTSLYSGSLDCRRFSDLGIEVSARSAGRSSRRGCLRARDINVVASQDGKEPQVGRSDVDISYYRFTRAQVYRRTNEIDLRTRAFTGRTIAVRSASFFVYLYEGQFSTNSAGYRGTFGLVICTTPSMRVASNSGNTCMVVRGA